MEIGPMLEYHVSGRRIDSHGSVASTKNAEIILDTDVRGRVEAFNSAELFLASIAACMIKGIERVTPMLKFDLRRVEVKLHGIWQDNRHGVPQRPISIFVSSAPTIRQIFGKMGSTLLSAMVAVHGQGCTSRSWPLRSCSLSAVRSSPRHTASARPGI
jgi:uncharacterized OsmC-like protein